MKHEPIEIEKLDKISELLKNSKEDDGTFFDSLYNLILFIELKKSEDDILNGRYYTLEEHHKRMEARYESYHHRISE